MVAVAFHHDRLMLRAHVEEQCATLDLRDSSSRRFPGGIGKSAVTIASPVVCSSMMESLGGAGIESVHSIRRRHSFLIFNFYVMLKSTVSTQTQGLFGWCRNCDNVASYRVGMFRMRSLKKKNNQEVAECLFGEVVCHHERIYR
jgi:hypothetical protein